MDALIVLLIILSLNIVLHDGEDADDCIIGGSD